MYISIHINIHTYMSISLKVNREEQQHQRGARGPGSASVTKAEQLPRRAPRRQAQLDTSREPATASPRPHGIVHESKLIRKTGHARVTR